MKESVLFGIKGMHCGSCARSLEAKFLTVEGVISSTVNASLGLARVVIDSAYLPNKAPLQQIIQKQGLEGYDVSFEAWHNTLITQLKQVTNRLFLSAFFSVWIMMLSIPFYFSVSMTYGMQAALIGALILLTTLLLFTASRTIWLMAWKNLRVGIYGTDLLVTIGHIAALALSFLSLAMGSLDVHFDAVAMLCLTQTIARYVEISQVNFGTKHLLEQDNIAAAKVLKTLPAQQDSPSTDWIECAAIQSGDIFQISYGDMVPVDCILQSSQSKKVFYFDLSSVTGESEPVAMQSGDVIPGGAVNTNTAVLLEATTAYGEATKDFHKLQALISMSDKPQLQKRLDSWAAKWMIGLAVIFLLQLTVILIQQDQLLLESLRQLTSVLLLGCPCALSLTCILPLHNVAEKWRHQGASIRSLASIEGLSAISTIVFDKTGTLTSLALTEGSQQKILNGWEKKHVSLLAVASKYSRHPAAEAIRDFLSNSSCDDINVIEYQEFPGKGVVLKVTDDQTVRLGSHDWLRAEGILLPKQEYSTIGFAINAAYLGCLAFHQAPLAGRVSLLGQLKQRGIKLILCSGDTQEAVREFQRKTQSFFDNIHAQYSPDKKRQLIEDYKNKGHQVAMVGDGINDIGAISIASVGIGFTDSPASGFYQDLQLATRKLVNTLPQFIEDAKKACQRSYFNSYIPIVSCSALVFLNFFNPISPLLVSITMLFNVISIYFLSKV